MKAKLKLNSVMIGTTQAKVLAEFYEKVLGKKPEMQEGEWSGWTLGEVMLTIGEHSETAGKASDPARMMFNLETEDVKGEFTRMKKMGATVIAEPYEMEGAWIATLADPDNNYFQLMSPWKDMK